MCFFRGFRCFPLPSDAYAWVGHYTLSGNSTFLKILDSRSISPYGSHQNDCDSGAPDLDNDVACAVLLKSSTGGQHSTPAPDVASHDSISFRFGPASP
jgi:hypothetical protein